MKHDAAALLDYICKGLDQAYENGYSDDLSCMAAEEVAGDIVAYDGEIGLLFPEDTDLDIMVEAITPCVEIWRKSNSAWAQAFHAGKPLL